MSIYKTVCGTEINRSACVHCTKGISQPGPVKILTDVFLSGGTLDTQCFGQLIVGFWFFMRFVDYKKNIE